ncbi:MAG: hypothetical protein ACXACC_02670 [Promethearchaeota archaeon]|jgi:hypothetical protein
MSDEVSEETRFWMKMIKKHWYVLIIYGLALVGLVVGGFLVLWKYIESWSGLPPLTTTFNDFSLGGLVLYIIFLIFVWLPVIGYCIIVTVILWYKILPEEDKQAMKSREKKGKKKVKKYGGSGGGGFLFFLVFMLVVYIDGNFWVAAGSLSYSYYIYAYLMGMMWIFIVLGIPFLIIIIIYLSKKWKQTPE